MEDRYLNLADAQCIKDVMKEIETVSQSSVFSDISVDQEKMLISILVGRILLRATL